MNYRRYRDTAARFHVTEVGAERAEIAIVPLQDDTQAIILADAYRLLTEKLKVSASWRMARHSNGKEAHVVASAPQAERELVISKLLLELDGYASFNRVRYEDTDRRNLTIGNLWGSGRTAPLGTPEVIWFRSMTSRRQELQKIVRENPQDWINLIPTRENPWLAELTAGKFG
jgi:hypothetical protein